MKQKKLLAVLMTAALAFGMVGCGSSSETTGETSDTASEDTTDDAAADDAADETAESGELTYAGITLGEDYTDITTTIKVLNHRTDLQDDTYPGTTWDQYIAAFNEMYPNITVEIETDTDYAESSLMKLQGGGWGDVMMIPAVDASEFPTYFIPYGTIEEMINEIRFPSAKMYDGMVYGVPSTGNAQGIVYNKAVFEKAGITTLPTTPSEFIDALQKIKDNTDAIPLYTNYAAEWTMGAWDAYVSGTATGDASYQNQKLVHTANPFQNYGDDTHAYAVYKILYDAVANGLTEDDYMTTDWEGCKGQINNGEIGCMVLGSWAFSQMRDAGEHGDDIGYMPFPITIDGKQYASSGADYAFGISNEIDETQQAAAMVFVKWMTEKSGFSYNEGGIPIAADDNNYPALYEAFANSTYVSDDAALAGEEDLLGLVNADSELMVNQGGNSKVMDIVVNAESGAKTFDEIMDEWNAAWTDAQESNGVEILY